MPTVRKTITVTDQHEDWIQSQIATGNYASDSEVVREALREKIERAAEIEAIRAKLIAAENSGFSDRTVDQIFDEAIARKQGKNG